MGVTIHFEGQLKGADPIDGVLTSARAFAAEAGWRCESLEEVVQKRKWLFRTSVPIRGLVIYAHEDAEPLRLAFDPSGRMDDFIKTQFAPPPVHIKVVELFRHLIPHFGSLDVDDEGEYWQTSDAATLESRMQECTTALAQLLASDPRGEGPVKLPNGRIADFMSEE